MNFNEARMELREGKKVKLPEWTGYWYADEDDVVKALCKNGNVEIADMLRYCNRLDFEATEGKLGFDFAINALKNGKLVARAGWNGKGMFLFMRPADTLHLDFIINKVKSLPQSLKDYLHAKDERQPVSDHSLDIIRFGAYICMKAADGSIVNGWLASQTDMLAEDWTIVE